MKKLFIVFILLTAITLKAQIKFGVNAGLHLSNLRERVDRNKPHSYSFITRLQLGTIVQIPLNENWCIYTGPYYSGKGYKYKTRLQQYNFDTERINLNYIELPVQIMYNVSGERANKLLVDGGLYFGYGFNGEHLYIGTPSRTEKHLHKKGASGYKQFTRWDVGYSFNAVYDFQNNYAFKFGVSQSILNVAYHGDRNFRKKNFVLGGSLIYFFKKRKAKFKALNK